MLQRNTVHICVSYWPLARVHSPHRISPRPVLLIEDAYGVSSPHPQRTFQRPIAKHGHIPAKMFEFHILTKFCVFYSCSKTKDACRPHFRVSWNWCRKRLEKITSGWTQFGVLLKPKCVSELLQKSVEFICIPEPAQNPILFLKVVPQRRHLERFVKYFQRF